MYITNQEESLIVFAFVGEHLLSASFTSIYMKIQPLYQLVAHQNVDYLEPSYNLKTRRN